jgi:hypothetical protein
VVLDFRHLTRRNGESLCAAPHPASAATFSPERRRNLLCRGEDGIHFAFLCAFLWQLNPCPLVFIRGFGFSTPHPALPRSSFEAEKRSLLSAGAVSIKPFFDVRTSFRQMNVLNGSARSS